MNMGTAADKGMRDMNSMRTILSIFFVLLSGCAPKAQVADECVCSDVFHTMVEKLETNYIGYSFLKGDAVRGYRARVDSFSVMAAHTEPGECASMMEEFLRYFGDGHLFVAEYPDFSKEQLNIFRTTLKDKLVDVAALKSHLIVDAKALSDIEGVWTDGESRFAITRNSDSLWEYRYVAVVLESPEKDKLGEVKLAVDRKGSEYEGVYYSNGYAPRYITLRPSKDNQLLNIRGGILWGRVKTTDVASIDTAPLYDPKQPTIAQLNDETLLLTIPTFLVEKKDLDGALSKQEDLVRRARYLIIDIRGNSGGNGIYFDLLRWYASRPAKSEIGQALASPDNLAYFKKFSGRGSEDPYAPVVVDMEGHMGALVKGPRFRDIELKPMDADLERVVILTDEANASAAETFILYSKQVSDKVVTCGTNTAGVVDYNNINMVSLNCRTYGTVLGYPTYTRHARIPEDGFNGAGIPPDIPATDSSVDMIAFALEYLTK